MVIIMVITQKATTEDDNDNDGDQSKLNLHKNNCSDKSEPESEHNQRYS